MPEESKLAEKLEEKQSEVKFNKEEMTKVNNIRNSYLSIQQNFGQLKLAQIKLDEQEIDLNNALKSIQDEEKKFLDGITEKYGQGTLNPQTGEFKPVDSKNKS